MLQNIFISDKCWSLDLSINQRILKKHLLNCFKYTKNYNNKCFLSSKSVYYYDFWRSCDTEDCSNAAENTALITEINYILTYIQIESSNFK